MQARKDIYDSVRQFFLRDVPDELETLHVGYYQVSPD